MSLDTKHIRFTENKPVLTIKDAKNALLFRIHLMKEELIWYFSYACGKII